jgi:hypothetical protein
MLDFYIKDTRNRSKFIRLKTFSTIGCRWQSDMLSCFCHTYWTGLLATCPMSWVSNARLIPHTYHIKVIHGHFPAYGCLSHLYVYPLCKVQLVSYSHVRFLHCPLSDPSPEHDPHEKVLHCECWLHTVIDKISDRDFLYEYIS